MRMVELTQILGNGMHPQRRIWVNPAHVMTVVARSNRDGYGQPQTGSRLHMVTGWEFEVAETLDAVIDLLCGVR